MRDAWEIMEELGVEIYGVSLDDVADLKAFAEAQTLNFELLSDPDGSVARKYGTLPVKGRFSQRMTFIIDDQGVLRHIDDQVDVNAHGMQLAELIVQLQE